MRDHNTPVTTEEEFSRRLDALLTEALQNGIAVEGSWACQQTRRSPYYEALITEVSHTSR